MSINMCAHLLMSKWQLRPGWETGIICEKAACRVATDRAEKNCLTFPEKFPDFSKSNF